MMLTRKPVDGSISAHLLNVLVNELGQAREDF